LGFDIKTAASVRKDAFLFGEGQGRIVISITNDNQSAVQDVLRNNDVPYLELGLTTNGEINVDGESFGNVQKWHQLYVNVLDTYLEN